jgi:CMP-N-acetylneuraminic acid synthetase
VKKRVYKADGSPVNHSIDRLEQTQHLPEILVENSNLFLFSRSSFYAAGKSRVGRKPRFFPMSILEGIDIDYEEDLRLAELIYRNSHLLAK